jgi:hypothetical protein
MPDLYVRPAVPFTEFTGGFLQGYKDFRRLGFEADENRRRQQAAEQSAEVQQKRMDALELQIQEARLRVAEKEAKQEATQAFASAAQSVDLAPQEGQQLDYWDSMLNELQQAGADIFSKGVAPDGDSLQGFIQKQKALAERQQFGGSIKEFIQGKIDAGMIEEQQGEGPGVGELLMANVDAWMAGTPGATNPLQIAQGLIEQEQQRAFEAAYGQMWEQEIPNLKIALDSLAKDLLDADGYVKALSFISAAAEPGSSVRLKYKTPQAFKHALLEQLSKDLRTEDEFGFEIPGAVEEAQMQLNQAFGSPQQMGMEIPVPTRS